MLKQRHYLDYNATAPLRPEARAAMQTVMDGSGNPSSVHAEGRAARARLDKARRQVAALAGCWAADVCFTGGGTEASNWALSAWPDRRILVSAVEHDAILRTAERLNGDIVPVDGHGRVDLDALGKLLTSDDEAPALVSVMAANNETGVVQPIAEVAAICRETGALLHVDAIQAAGKMMLADLVAVADLISLSAHKIGGPAGTGALIVRSALQIPPMIVGGGQESWRRAGTENLIGIAGFGAAAEATLAELESGIERMKQMQRSLETGLRAACPSVEVMGDGVARLPNTTCVRMPGVAAETQVMALDLAGIAVSAGSACSSGKVTPSHVLTAMGQSRETAAEAIRVSTGWTTTAEDIDALLLAWSDLWNRKRAA
ncbi:MAG: cysteine desulfurase family protein [Minwuia sp.]|nr:cysteine desulfurase family protein [Minwuia sp.]